MRAIYATVLASAFSFVHAGAGDAEVIQSNMEEYSAPAFQMQNVSFSFLFTCLANQDCWHHSTGGTTPVYSGFNRDYLRASIESAFNWHSAALHSAGLQLHTYNGISLDRVVEQTGALDSEFTSYSGHWNVMVRATVHDVPLEVAQDFMPVITRMFGMNVGTYGSSPGYSPDKATMHWESVWISTQAYFLDDKLEPVVGRGHKSQRLLIPLLLGIVFMLAVPILFVACIVTQQQAITDAMKKLSVEEDKFDRLERDVKEKDAQVLGHKKTDEENETAAKLRARAVQRAHETELEPADIDWLGDK